MALKNSQYDAIMRDYNRKQLAHRRILEAHRQEIRERLPQMAEIDRQVASLSLTKARAILNHQPDDLDLAQEIGKLSHRRKELLREAGYPEDYLELSYDCPLCKDTGYIGNEKCTCFKRAVIDLLYTQSNLRGILKTENFDHFSLDYYSDKIKSPATGLTAREMAMAAVRTARSFVSSFDNSHANLFLYGDTGVGKTFLSHCIAKELIDSAHSVIYFSAFDLFDQLAKSAFSRQDTQESSMLEEYLYDCDLLIIDDLGTELTNAFVSSQLFLCINERLTRRKSTLISTNLSLEQFSDTYSERVFSRISSSYTMLKLIGNDIRIQKKLLGGA
ncbi:MAG TPA: ATP-binding protein [Candidatus Egerieimonas intestinavium]|uniref:ATP-binding protein n=1 Tax=Candidatus Egerieimonas intestinavium TaxID=2840777 RepID=A0A9D1EHU8_9FIRM|nr:ATP-binding protein [Candidatus Egerieimonas intestinavium]